MLAVVLSVFGMGAAFADIPDTEGFVEVPSVTGVAVNSRGDLFASGQGTDIRRFDGLSTEQTGTLSGMNSSAWSLAVDANDRLYAASGDGMIYYYDDGSTTPDGALVGAELPPEECEEPCDPPAPTYTTLNLFGITIDSAGNVYAVGSDSDDEKIFVWENIADNTTVTPTRELPGIDGGRGIAIAPNGDLYVGTLGVDNGNDSVFVIPNGDTTPDPTLTITGVHNVQSLAFGGLNNRLHVAGWVNAGAGPGIVREYNQNTQAFTNKTYTGIGTVIGIAFEPDGTDDIPDTLWAADWSNGKVQRFTPGYAMEIDPGLVDYGEVLQGQQVDQVLTVKNIGVHPLVFGSDTATLAPVEGGNASGLSVLDDTNTCRNLTLPVDDTCTVTVRFAPNARGLRQGSLTITPNSPADPEVVPLSGTGIAPILSKSTTELNFDEQLVTGGATASQDITITNDGDADLVISSVTEQDDADGNFTLINAGNCQTTLAPGATCTVSAAFDPVSVGDKTAFVRFVAAAPETTHNVSLAGTGTAPVFSATGDGDFGGVATDHASAARTFTIKNTGNASMPVTGVSLVGGDSDQFTVDTDNCTGATVTTSPASSCTVAVKFTPGSVLGAKQTTLRVTSSSLIAGYGEIALQGTATTPIPHSTPNPATLNFDPMVVGSPTLNKVLTITNDGSATLNWDAQKFTIADNGHGSFTVLGTTCASTLAENASCQVTVSYNAAAAVDHTATLTLHNDAPVAQTVSLSGKGIQTAQAPVSVSAVAGDASAIVSWTATANSGNSTVTGHSVQIATDPNGPWSPAPGGCDGVGNVTSCVTGELANDVTYYFRVAAINGAGTGTHSAASNGVTPVDPFAVGPPTTPVMPPATPGIPPRVAQVLGRCVKLPGSIKKTGVTVVKKGVCKTNAGVNVKYKIKKPGSIKLIKKKRNISLLGTGKKGKVTITLTAPAVNGFAAFKLKKVYKIK